MLRRVTVAANPFALHLALSCAALVFVSRPSTLQSIALVCRQTLDRIRSLVATSEKDEFIQIREVVRGKKEN